MNPPPEKHAAEEPPISSSSSSSSNSDSEEEDFFQLESTDLSKRPPSAPIFVDNEIGLSAKRISRKPPPGARYDVPDPNRIPMSVFARNAATASPKEWSVASNESLFSIRMGNSSFSREQGLFLMGRSGDLGGFTSGILDYPPPRPPVVKGAVEGKEKVVDVNEVKEEVEDEEEEKQKTMGSPLADGISRQSDCSSTTSFGSFAFPLLASEGKSESIKVMSKQYAEHQPPPLINPLNAPTTKPTPPLASAKRRWFSCFSWCQLCS